MSDDENRGKFDFWDSKKTYGLLGGIAMGFATIIGFADKITDKLWPKAIPDSRAPMLANQIQEMEGQIQALILEIAQAQEREFKQFRETVRKMESQRRVAEKTKARMASLVEAEYRYQQQDKLLIDARINKEIYKLRSKLFV